MLVCVSHQYSLASSTLALILGRCLQLLVSILVLHQTVAERNTISLNHKRIMAWANPTTSEAGAEQIAVNKSWVGLFTGVMGFCGTDFASDGTIVLNETTYQGCSAVKKAVDSKAAEFHMCLGTVPAAAIANPSVTVASAVAMAKQHGWAGYNIDDESHTAPRGDIPDFKAWVRFINSFADGLHAHGLQLTADVQSVTIPWHYKPVPELSELLSNSSIDRWINMDT